MKGINTAKDRTYSAKNQGKKENDQANIYSNFSYKKMLSPHFNPPPILLETVGWDLYLCEILEYILIERKGGSG